MKYTHQDPAIHTLKLVTNYFHVPLANPVMPSMISVLPKVPTMVSVPLHIPVPPNTHLHAIEYHRLLDSITDSSYDDWMWKPLAILRHSKIGIQLQVHILWYDGERTWQDVNPLQYSNPLLLIQYAYEQQLTSSPDWSWVRAYPSTHTTLMATTITMKAAKYENKIKSGVEVPATVRHALQLDSKNGNHLWAEAIQKELDQINAYKTFRDLKDEPIPPGYKRIPYHVVFDVKFDLRRKARLVAGGHLTDPPKEDIYSGVVGTESIRIAFLLAAMNNLDVCTANIENAFPYRKITLLQDLNLALHKGSR